MSGPPLGRPPANISQAQKKQAQLDERVRNSIEGKFGQAKRRFSLNRGMTKLPSTSETAMGIAFLTINLSRLLRQALWLFLCLFQKLRHVLSKTYLSNWLKYQLIPLFSLVDFFSKPYLTIVRPSDKSAESVSSVIVTCSIVGNSALLPP